MYSDRTPRAGMRIGRWLGRALALVAFASVNLHAAHTSVQCTPKSGTVTRGGTVSVDVTTCAVTIGFAGIGTVDGPALPAHGAAILRVTGSSWFVDYSHNNDAATTDYFEFTDGTVAGNTVGVTITINPSSSPIVVSPSTLPTMTAGTPVSQTLSSVGGVAPYSYALQSGILPIGLSLSPTGLLSGTPTQRGGYTFSVRSTDSRSPTAQFVDKGYTGTVQNPTLTLASPGGTAIQNVVFTQSLTVSGGVAPYSCLLETGALPAGISLSSGCVVSGTTAAAAGNYPVAIRVTDASTGPGSYFELENYTLTVSPPPSVSIAVSPLSVSEDALTNLVFVVTRSLNLSSPTVVNLSTGGTATAGIDYTGNAATVTIPAGATTASITINPTADATVEPDETVSITVAAGAGYSVGAPSSATGTILNDDVPTATISVSPASVAEDGVTNLVFTVNLSQPATTAVSVNFTVAGTAINGVDYAAIASPVTIPAGSSSATITVNPTADATIEADETVSLALAAGSGYTVGVPGSAVGTILNDDLPTLTINDVSQSEGDSGVTNFVFTVSLSAPAGPAGVSFDIATANGTATAGTDYTAQTLTGQVIPAGSSTYTFTVQVTGDTFNEATETFFVNVTNVLNAIVVDGQGVGTITNDDPLPSLSINNASVTEGNSGTTNAVFTVLLSEASGQPVSVNYATAAGTAAATVDFVSTSGTLTFTPGQTTRTITVPVVGELVPEVNETFFVNLSAAVNATIAVSQGTGTIVNDDTAVTLNPASLVNGAVAAAYNQTIAASGGAAPYAYSLIAGTLPSGLTLSPGGVLSGTPTGGGSFSFTVSASDSSPPPGPFSGNQAYTVIIGPPTIALPSAALPTATLGISYSTSNAAPASGGTAPYSYALIAGALPSGIMLNATTGVISGIPGALGNYSFTVQATDSSTGTGPYTGNRAYSINVVDQPPIAADSTLTLPYNAPATNVPLALSGGPATSVAVVSAPSHGTVLVTGPASVTYQPVAGYAGPDSFTYRANNTGGPSALATVSVTVANPVLSVSAAGVLTAAVATAYSQTFTFNGGAQPWTNYAVAGLPPGVTVTATAANSVTVSGTPTQAGSFNLNVTAMDASTGNGPFTFSQPFTLTVAPPTLVMSPANGTTMTATYNAPFTQTIVASGGVGPYSYVLGGGPLLAGLSFNTNSGQITGTATASGTVNFSVTATDTGATGTGAPFTVQRNYVLTVAAPSIAINPANLAPATVATAYSQTLTATGGIAPYSFSLTAGALPAGITLSSAGVVAGSATAGGSFVVTITAADSGTGPASGAQTFTLTVAPPTIIVTPVTLPNGTVGKAYSQTLASQGGTAPYAFAFTSGTLPAGLTLSAAGVLSGLPTTAGASTFAVRATDSSTGTGPYLATQNFTVTVNPGTQTVSFAPVTPIPVSPLPVALSATASSGLTPLTFSTTSAANVCALNGDRLFATGVGTCTVTATQAGNANYLAASATASIVINAAVPNAPVIDSASPDALRVTIHFTPPAFTGGSPITAYVATCVSDAGGVHTASGTSSPLVVSGLVPGMTYRCTVVASNAVGSSAASNAILVSSPALPVPALSDSVLLVLALLCGLLAVLRARRLANGGGPRAPTPD